MSKVFVDTNVLVYSVDYRVREKRSRARKLLESLPREGYGVISTQVMQEFYVVATRKLGIDALIAKNMLNALRGFETVTVDIDLIKEAVDCSILDRLSFWDALIIVAAEKAQCSAVWSEDLNDGQVVRGVRIENPFKDTKAAGPRRVKDRGAAYRRKRTRKKAN